MFFHGKCKSYVYADLTNMLKIVCSFSPGKNVMVAGRGDVVILNEVVDAKYYCPTCKDSVTADEITFTCSQCGKPTRIPDGFKRNEGGQIYCATCKKNEVGDYTFKPLIKMAGKFSIKNI